jgi:hypothetical protein
MISVNGVLSIQETINSTIATAADYLDEAVSALDGMVNSLPDSVATPAFRAALATLDAMFEGRAAYNAQTGAEALAILLKGIVEGAGFGLARGMVAASGGAFSVGAVGVAALTALGSWVK